MSCATPSKRSRMQRSPTAESCTGCTKTSEGTVGACATLRLPLTQAARFARRAATSNVHFPEQPGFRQLPLAHHGAGRDVERFGSLFDAQSAEKSHLYDLALSRIERGKRIQSVINGQEGGASLLGYDQRFIQRHLLRPRAALLRAVGARVLHEDAAHQPRRYREEVRAVLPFHLTSVHEPYIRLVHERGRLQRVSRALMSHVPTGDAAELSVNQRDQLLEGRLVPVAP